MKVYKYRGGDEAGLMRHLDLLLENKFWAATAGTLNDPAEAYVDDQMLRGALTAPGAAEVLGAFETLTTMRGTVGVYSLSRTPSDELMWAYYSAGHTGFCIEYDLERLCLEARSSWNVLDVAYRQRPQTIQLEDVVVQDDAKSVLTKMIGTKSSRWAHEQELRIVTTSPGLNHHSAEAVTGVYFGCRCSTSFIALSRERLRGRGIRFYRMAFSSTSYDMTAEELPRLPEDESEEWLAPIEEAAVPEPELISARDRSYHPYLERAVDRVRRDRSCAKVLLVDFSVNPTGGNRPTIYVLYETNVPTQFSNMVKQYFEIDELDD